MTLNEHPFCGFLDDERVETLAGKTIAAAWTDSSYPRLLLVFTDGTAAIICEDTSCCYYVGEHGGMMIDDPYDGEKERARQMFEAWKGQAFSLYSAAMKLLEACQEALKRIESDIESEAFKCSEGNLLRDAIAKATAFTIDT